MKKINETDEKQSATQKKKTQCEYCCELANGDTEEGVPLCSNECYPGITIARYYSEK